MKIEDAGELRTFETVPTEKTFYFSIVLYPPDFWASGPSGDDKQDVISSVMRYHGITDARIYSAKVPISLRKEGGE